jgi:TolB-like protein/Tfp pilus assembly protein PilF
MELDNRRLESWKEIAAYLGRDVRTVQRWERQEALPVHRLHHSKLGSVYSYTAEIDAWRLGRQPDAGSQPAALARAVPENSDRPGRLLFKAGILTSVLALGLGLVWLASRLLVGQNNSVPHIESLAVLPFDNFSGDPEQTYFADGMTEALIGNLSSIRNLRVVSRTSVMQFRQTVKPAPVIGRELGVDAIVEGSVQREGDRVRIAIQLIRAAADEHLWSATYDRELRDLLGLQSEMALAIAHQIEAAVSSEERVRLTAAHTVTPDAYESYVRGRFQLTKSTREAVEQGAADFRRAIAADPLFAPAHAGLAKAYQAFGGTGVGVMPVVEARSKAVAAARRALELDPQLADAHTVLAGAHVQEWQWDAAEAKFLRAIDLDPSNAPALAAYAGLLMSRGQTEQAIATARRARELDPLSLGTAIHFGWLLYHARRYDESIRELRTVLAVEPNNVGALWFLGFALIEDRQFSEAIGVLQRGAHLSNRSPAVLGVMTRAYARAGDRTSALRILDELKTIHRRGYVPPAVFLNAYIGLGEYDQAFRWLERAYEEHSNITQLLKTHPLFDPVRENPQFTGLMRRVGFD